jgi:caa(3)-type oxidase subunit IV
MADHAHAHHRNYVKIWGILLVLLVISIVGPMTGIRVVMLITAFGVAAVKAYIVAKNFMHLDVEKPIVQWMLAIAVAFMVLLFAGVAPDVMKDKGERWKKDAGFHGGSRHVPAHGADHGGTDQGGSGTGGGH